ncbi:hypothetical protein AgCh_040250 [Apium graveolens]
MRCVAIVSFPPGYTAWIRRLTNRILYVERPSLGIPTYYFFVEQSSFSFGKGEFQKCVFTSDDWLSRRDFAPYFGLSPLFCLLTIGNTLLAKDAAERRPGSGFPAGRGTGDGHLKAHHDLQARPARPGKATRLGVRALIHFRCHGARPVSYYAFFKVLLSAAGGKRKKTEQLFHQLWDLKAEKKTPFLW